MTHDLTINAMAVNVHDVVSGRSARVIDPTGGMRDIEDWVVRMVSPGSFADDPVRVLRSLRFSHALDYRAPHGGGGAGSRAHAVGRARRAGQGGAG